MSFSYSPKPVIDSSLVLYLDAANNKSYVSGSTTWNDLSTNANKGILANGPVYNSSNSGCILFDGTDDFVNLGTIPQIAPSTGDFTFDFWINPTNWNATYAPIFTTTITNGLWIGKLASTFVLRTYNVADDLVYGTLPTVNVWTNVVIRRSGSTANIYYNTVSVVSGTVTRNYVQGVSEISRDGTTNVFSGKISSIKYYNRALTTAEMLQNYNTLKSRFGK
jgi:hypothetical protein